MTRALAVALLALGLAVHGATGAPEALGPPTLVLYGGTVLTVDPKRPKAQAIAVRGSRIVAVGSSRAVLRLARASTRRVNLRGRTVLPGFVDSHTHLFNTGDPGSQTLEARQQLALQNGITALGDMFVPPDLLQRMKAFAAAGRLRVRTSLYPIYTDNCGRVQGIWFADEGPIRAPTRMLRIPGAKIFLDGGSCRRPAISWTYPPGAPGAGTRGDLYFSESQLLPAATQLQNLGWQIAVHVLGDRAADVALDLFRDLLRTRANTPRYRIEHNTLLRDDQLKRYGQIGVVATIFGAFGTCAFNQGGFARADLVPAAYRYLWRWRDLVAANPRLRIAWSSDWPVFSANPFDHFYGFVSRRQIDADGSVCKPEAQEANDTISRARALRMMTLDAAYALGQDSVVGSLKPGKLADLVIVSRNPLTVPVDRIPGIRVLVTTVGARAAYCAPGSGALCPH